MVSLVQQYKVVMYGITGFVLLTLIIFREYIPLNREQHYSSCSGKAPDTFSCDSKEKPSNFPSKRSKFPRHIHQIFFYETDTIIPERLETARKTWSRRQLNFRYTLWNASMIEHLIYSSYPCLLNVYHSYTHWVRRADMARYVVLYKYGGIYVDIDIKSRKKTFHTLLSGLNSTSGIALYVSKPAAVSNDFMIAKPKHPFMKSVLCGLEGANKWYVFPYLTTMLTTGPLYLHNKYKEYEPKSDIEIIPVANLSRHIIHIDGSSWLQMDGQLIWWTFVHRKRVIRLICCMLLLGTCCLFIRKYRNKFSW